MERGFTLTQPIKSDNLKLNTDFILQARSDLLLKIISVYRYLNPLKIRFTSINPRTISLNFIYIFNSTSPFFDNDVI